MWTFGDAQAAGIQQHSMVQAVLLDLFMSEPDTSAAAKHNIMFVVYVAKTNKHRWPEYIPSLRAVVKCWPFLLCRTCIPSSRWAVAGCMHPQVAMADELLKAVS